MECLPLLSSKLLCEQCGRTSCSNESAVNCITVSPTEKKNITFLPFFVGESPAVVGNSHLFGLPTSLHMRMKSLL